MIRASILAVAASVALLGLAHLAWDPTPTHAVEQTVSVSAATTTDGPPTLHLQQDATTNDDLLDVQMWTLFASGGAAALGLLLFLARMAMGWVKPPPPQPETSH